MNVWRVCERAELGKVGRQWELKRDGQLSAGRSPDSDIHVQSMSVENRHALFEWNIKMQAFTVKDLGSVNGTYINNRPIRRQGSAMLNHGDVVRLGYEKTHVFRIEEKFPSPAHSIAKPTTPQHTVQATNSSVTTQTSPRNDVVPASAPPLYATSTVTPHNPNTQQQVASPAQPQTIILPQAYIHQQSPVPLVVPQFGYPGSSPISLHSTPMGHVTPPVPLYPAPTGHVTIPQASSAFHPISPTQFLQVSTPPPASVMSSDSPQSVDELESSGSSYTKSQRSDGRRTVELSNSPSLSKVSKLYGKPSWWGEEKATEKENSQEFEFVKPGSQILRDYDRGGRSPSCEDPLLSSNRPHRHSASEDLRYQALSNSTECGSPASSWVVDFGSGDNNAAKKRPSRLDRLEQHRPRSADPSPNRSPQIKKDLLPATVSLRRSSSTRRSPSPSPQRSPVMTRRPQSMSIRNKQQGSGGGGGESTEQSLFRSKTVVKRPPSGGGSLTRTKTTVKKGSPVHSSSGSAKARKSSLETVSQAANVKSSKKQAGGVKEASGKRDVSSNETYITEPLTSSSLEDSQSQSDVSVSASGQVGSGTADTADLKSSSASEMQRGDSRPGSARKQWTSEHTQVPDGLMLASIEARIRQLSKLAHVTARQLSCLQRSLQDVPGVVVHSIPPTSPLGSQRGVDPRLPEWRFNKEGDSIFRGMRTVEKWLKDIEATINSIQVGTAVDGGGTADAVSEVEYPTESTDYQPEYETTESEVEAILQDSIEQFYSFSDTEDSCF